MAEVTSADDVGRVVEQLMVLERRRLEVLEEDRDEFEAESTALEELDRNLENLQTVLDNLQKESTFLSRNASTSDSSVVTATAESNAAITTYTVSGVTLAESANVASDTTLGLAEGTKSTLQSTADIAATSLDANAEFSSGAASTGLASEVSAGSFSVNNKTITVVESDTVFTVLSKINSSGAGVVATISDTAGDERVLLTNAAVGTAGITLSTDDDSSGFLAAVNLTAAVTANGTNHEFQQNFDQVTAFSSVTDGFFNINGVTFALDVDSDTLDEVIGEINSSAAGVSAFYDEDLDKVTLRSIDEGEDLILNNDTSGFLAAIEVLDLTGDTDADAGESTYQGTDATVRINGVELTKDSNTFEINGATFTIKSTGSANVTVSRNTDKAAGELNVLVRRFNEVMEFIDNQLEGEDAPLRRNTLLAGIKRELRSQVISQVDNPGTLSRLADVGVTLNFAGENAGKLTFDSGILNSAFEDDEQSVFRLFANDGNGDGRFDDTGFSPVMDDYLELLTQRAVGFIDTRVQDIERRLERQEERITREEDRLDLIERNLTEEFFELFDSSLNLQAQGANLNNVLSAVGNLV